MRARVASLTLAVAAVAACGNASPGDRPEPTIEGTTWRALKVEDGAPLPGTEITIHLGPGPLTGFAGCNEFASSRLTISNGSFVEGRPFDIGPISSDHAVCDGPGVMKQESDFLDDLAAINLVRIEDGRLILEGTQGELQFEPVQRIE